MIKVANEVTNIYGSKFLSDSVCRGTKFKILHYYVMFLSCKSEYRVSHIFSCRSYLKRIPVTFHYINCDSYEYYSQMQKLCFASIITLLNNKMQNAFYLYRQHALNTAAHSFHANEIQPANITVAVVL